MVRYADENGVTRTLLDEQDKNRIGANMSFPRVPESVKYLDITYVMTKSRVVDFLARPDPEVKAK